EFFKNFPIIPNYFPFFANIGTFRKWRRDFIINLPEVAAKKRDAPRGASLLFGETAILTRSR
ncbi:MAG: hypothetical protein K2H61_09745, partial [Muribaculaceae bacterium]|nr:hypothetical protein [Muribaculaceae bacterium]